MDDPGNDADDDDDVPDLVENFDECCKNEAKETIEKVEEVVEEVVATPAEGILLSNHYFICISLRPSPLFYATVLKRTLGYFLENLKKHLSRHKSTRFKRIVWSTFYRVFHNVFF